MKKIGFRGGALMHQLGSANDVMSFFYCIEQFASEGKEQKFDLLLNRFYRNYLRLGELDIAVNLMDEVHECFKTVDSKKVEWDTLLLTETSLDTKKAYLSDVFSRYFLAFNNVVESAQMFYEGYKKYQAVTIIVADIPENLKSKKLPLDEYDTVIGDPLWVRDANGENPLVFKNGVAYIRQ